MSSANDHHPPSPAPDEFYTTQWSMVLRAGQGDDSAADDALARLCERYWYPLYAYARRHTTDVHAAQDAIQGFFARLLEKGALAAASPDRGRFRAFLLTALKNFLANEADRERTLKRGGGSRTLALDFDSGESQYLFEPADHLTPERWFERNWALTLLNSIMSRLAAEYAAAGKTRQFDLLRGTLVGDRDQQPYAELAAELAVTEDNARQLARRLRLRYRELLRAEVAQTVATPDEIDDEIRSLFSALGSAS